MLYYVSSTICYGTPDNPRISSRVYRVSDTTRLGRVIAWQGTKALDTPTWLSPSIWLSEALEQWLAPQEP